MARSAPRTVRVGLDVKVGCDRCDVTLFILRRGLGVPFLTCHGKRMTPRGPRSCADALGPLTDGMAAGHLYTDPVTGLIARCTRGGPGIASCDGRPLTAAEAALPSLLPVAREETPRGRAAPATRKVGLALEARRIRWNAVDWACACARQSGQRTLPVLLDSGLWWRAELDTIAADETIAAWSAIDESVHDAIAERVLGWGLDPVIRPLAWRAPQQAFRDAGVRPDILLASQPGRLSWLSRAMIRRLRRGGWLVSLVE